MSKTVGKILAIAALVVVVVSLPGVGLVGAGAVISAATAAYISAAIAVATLANGLLMPKAKQQARQASIIALSIGEVPREAAFGQCMTGGSLVDAFNYGGQNGTDWECIVIALADHHCEALVGFYVNDIFVSYAGDGAVAGFGGQLEVYWRSGAAGQTVPGVILSNGPGWTANDVGTGISWVAACYKADKPDAQNPIWPAGRPRFAWVLKGKKCYQARKDSTVAGGSGTHRWDNPATWQWTDNPIDCRYNWARGVYALDQVANPEMLLIGRGLSPIEAPLENVAPRANICDELVALDAGGTEKRYRANGIIQADETFITVEEWFASACAGIITQPEGSVEIEPGHAKSPVFYFSDDDLVTGSPVKYNDSPSDQDGEWLNTVIPRYVEPTQKYADHAAPVRRIVGDVIADGGPREETLSLPLVTSSTQAGRCGEIRRRMGRLHGRAVVTLGPRFAEVEEGDWCVWTSNRYLKGASVTFQVQAFSCDQKWQNTLTLRQIATSVFAKDADAASGAVATQQDVPSPIPAPGVSAWALSAVSLSAGPDGTPALLVQGACDNDFATQIRFEYWPDDGVTSPAAVTAWTSAGITGPDVVRREVSGVTPNAVYYVAVTYLIGSTPGDRRILGPVTTPNGPTRNVDRGPWSALANGTAFIVGDEVQDQNSTWGCITAHAKTAGNGPPTLPTTSNTNWRLRAKAGDAGAPGSNGLNTAVVFAYQRATSAPAVPSTTATFTFASGALTGLNNGWSATIPAGTNPLYVIAATASASGASDTIATGEWTTPQILVQNGVNGADGLNAATVYLYQRNNTGTPPAVPGASTTYTFATGVLSGTLGGWTQSVPASSGGKYLFVTTATAAGSGATDTIGTSEWATVQLLAQDGADGAPGATGNTIKRAYKRAVTIPSTPTGNNVPSGWSASLPSADGNPAWASDAEIGPNGTTLVGSWTTPVMIEAVTPVPGGNTVSITAQSQTTSTFTRSLGNGQSLTCAAQVTTGVGTGNGNQKVRVEWRVSGGTFATLGTEASSPYTTGEPAFAEVTDATLTNTSGFNQIYEFRAIASKTGAGTATVDPAQSFFTA